MLSISCVVSLPGFSVSNNYYAASQDVVMMVPACLSISRGNYMEAEIPVDVGRKEKTSAGLAEELLALGFPGIH